jgi:hypothetical protein
MWVCATQLAHTTAPLVAALRGASGGKSQLHQFGSNLGNILLIEA